MFTTITDVKNAIIWADSALAAELTEDQIEEIITSNMSGRYEDITGEEFENMIVAAYVATGIDESVVRGSAADQSSDYQAY